MTPQSVSVGLLMYACRTGGARFRPSTVRLSLVNIIGTPIAVAHAACRSAIHVVVAPGVK